MINQEIKGTNLYESGINGLAKAIVLQAFTDYEAAISVLSTEYETNDRKEMKKISEIITNAERMKIDCERFFASQYIKLLTEIDGDAIKKHVLNGVLSCEELLLCKKNVGICSCGNEIKTGRQSFQSPVIKCSKCRKYWRILGKAKQLF